MIWIAVGVYTAFELSMKGLRLRKTWDVWDAIIKQYRQEDSSADTARIFSMYEHARSPYLLTSPTCNTMEARERRTQS